MNVNADSREASIFDASRAEFPTIVLPRTLVVDLLPLSHVPERIAEYREQMRRGDSFPPISVIRLAGRYVIADGHKRFSAHAALGQDRILVEVWPRRRWLQDQWTQAVSNGRKNRRILAASISNPAEARRLLLTTLLHWRRVARSLMSRAARRSS